MSIQATSTTFDAAAAARPAHQHSLVIANISKVPNVRKLLQVGAAFGCAEIFVVGQKNFNFCAPSPPPISDTLASDHNHQEEQHHHQSDLPRNLIPAVQAGRLHIRRFAKWNEFVNHVRSRSIRLLGVEIHPMAQTIAAEIARSHCFTQQQEQQQPHHIAVLMGNEGTGIHPKHMQDCDGFVRIPQYGGGTASLNVYVAASIVLYHFHQHQQLRKSEHDAQTECTLMEGGGSEPKFGGSLVR
jgi:tRNA(Leu) C34 or U34 (ribose-2'-O)-methylase TrmL